MKRSLTLLACLVGALFLAFVTTLWLVGLPKSFYDFNLMQAITPVVQIAIAVGLAIFVNVKLSNRSKRNELLVSRLEKFEGSLGALHGLAIEYMENKKAEIEPKILEAMKNLSRQIHVLKKMADHSDFNFSYHPKQMEGDFFDYKKALTSEAFKQADVEYGVEAKNRVENINRRIEEKIILQKLDLYR